jgi:preprotein translocase subunit SecD
MSAQLRWKFILISIVILVCLFGLIGFPTSWAQIGENFKSRIQLGLDLRGGSHLVLQVQVADAIRQRSYEAIDDLKKELRTKGVNFGDVQSIGDTQFLVKNVDPVTSGTFGSVIASDFQDWSMAPAAGQPNSYLLTMKPSVVSDIQQNTMEQAQETISRRINALGLGETNVAPTGRGDNELIVELPGVGDPTRAKEVIQAGGQLAFHKVLDAQPYQSEAAALSAHGGVLPPDAELVPGSPEGAPGEGEQSQVYYLLDRVPIVTGTDLRSASTSPSTKYPGQYQVNFTLSNVAASRFGPFTAANVGNSMAVVLDNKVVEAAVIQSRIDDQGEIEGNFTQQSAQDLALVLKSGALPAPIKYLEEQTIGPSLGIESIHEGVRASIGSLLAVMIFLVIYYRLAGVNAVVALFLNLVILMAFMALSGAVLTLPGIAGVVLTIGMGVDSNVLVFERIREELRAGKAPASAVAIGFERAFLTIIDTHITTLVSAAFLFLFGTGPVKGFAITLIIGLLANLFTSIYVSRAIFDLHLARMPRQAELSI